MTEEMVYTITTRKRILNKHFLYIGITESLQNSVDILAQKLGFPNVIIPHENVSKMNESIPDGTREEFIENNLLEYAIYEYARNNYGNQLAEKEGKVEQSAL